jgi:hypothetical protein
MNFLTGLVLSSILNLLINDDLFSYTTSAISCT